MEFCARHEGNGASRCARCARERGLCGAARAPAGRPGAWMRAWRAHWGARGALGAGRAGGTRGFQNRGGLLHLRTHNKPSRGAHSVRRLPESCRLLDCCASLRLNRLFSARRGLPIRPKEAVVEAGGRVHVKGGAVGGAARRVHKAQGRAGEGERGAGRAEVARHAGVRVGEGSAGGAKVSAEAR